MQLDLIKNDGLVSAKRTKNERMGVHGWHPYYAGYAEAFVEASIDYLKLTPAELILDPWNGSGTTPLVCSRRDISVIGCDVNEAMNTFSMAKTGLILDARDSLLEVAMDISQVILDSNVEINEKDPLLAFMSKSLAGGVRLIHDEILKNSFKKRILKKNLKAAILQKKDCEISPESKFLMAVLFVTARKLAGYKGGSNPTWVKTLEVKPSVKRGTLSKTFLATVEA